MGKSALFNQLTGLDQIIGNWPGKTVERAEGTLHYATYRISILDLPGIYSLSTFSMEEIVARDYIAIDRPDVIVNVVDASALERNLYFTLQLLELEAPVVMALNQVDCAARKGVNVQTEDLSGMLGIPVVETIAISGTGVSELLSTVVEVAEGKIQLNPLKVRYGREVEESIEKLERAVIERLPRMCRRYPARWIAIKLLERDDNVKEKVRAEENGGTLLALSDVIVERVEQLHSEPSSVVLASERYAIASRIARQVTKVVSPPQVTLADELSSITTHRILGYPILVAVVALMFASVFVAGGVLVSLLENLFEHGVMPVMAGILTQVLPPAIVELVNEGLLSGVVAGVTVALPYIVPFYIILALLEDSGYLPRAAFLMDHFMHKIGLHGKAFIPLLLGYGCSVPACVGCRVMETDRERFLAGFVLVLIPCAARTVIILGLVGRYVGIYAALALYLFDLALVFLLGRLAFKLLPGEPVGLIMEMPPYRMPSLRSIVKKTWARTKEFIYVAFPIIIIGSLFLRFLVLSELIWPIVDSMTPLLTGWLGLPPVTGVPIIFGILRKELTLILLTELAGTLELNQVLTPIQMIVFALIAMIYVPCVATIGALAREFGWKRAVAVTVLDVLLAVFLGGVAYRVLLLLA